MNEFEKEIFDGLFPSPLAVINTAGQLQHLEWDKSEYPLMFNNDGVPVAILKLSNGNGAKIRFDVKPPSLSEVDFKPNRFLIDDADFITLAKATRDGRSVEDYLFLELFKYPFKIADADTGKLTTFIVNNFTVHDIGGVPVAVFLKDDGCLKAVRFDYDPPQLYLLNYRDGEILGKTEFVELVKKSREERFGMAILYRLNEKQ